MTYVDWSASFSYHKWSPISSQYTGYIWHMLTGQLPSPTTSDLQSPHSIRGIYDICWLVSFLLLPQVISHLLTVYGVYMTYVDWSASFSYCKWSPISSQYTGYIWHMLTGQLPSPTASDLQSPHSIRGIYDICWLVSFLLLLQVISNLLTVYGVYMTYVDWSASFSYCKWSPISSQYTGYIWHMLTGQLPSPTTSDLPSPHSIRGIYDICWLVSFLLLPQVISNLLTVYGVYMTYVDWSASFSYCKWSPISSQYTGYIWHMLTGQLPSPTASDLPSPHSIRGIYDICWLVSFLLLLQVISNLLTVYGVYMTYVDWSASFSYCKWSPISSQYTGYIWHMLTGQLPSPTASDLPSPHSIRGIYDICWLVSFLLLLQVISHLLTVYGVYMTYVDWSASFSYRKWSPISSQYTGYIWHMLTGQLPSPTASDLPSPHSIRGIYDICWLVSFLLLPQVISNLLTVYGVYMTYVDWSASFSYCKWSPISSQYTGYIWHMLTGQLPSPTASDLQSPHSIRGIYDICWLVSFLLLLQVISHLLTVYGVYMTYVDWSASFSYCKWSPISSQYTGYIWHMLTGQLPSPTASDLPSPHSIRGIYDICWLVSFLLLLQVISHLLTVYGVYMTYVDWSASFSYHKWSPISSQYTGYIWHMLTGQLPSPTASDLPSPHSIRGIYDICWLVSFLLLLQVISHLLTVYGVYMTYVDWSASFSYCKWSPISSQYTGYIWHMLTGQLPSPTASDLQSPHSIRGIYDICWLVSFLLLPQVISHLLTVYGVYMTYVDWSASFSYCKWSPISSQYTGYIWHMLTGQLPSPTASDLPSPHSIRGIYDICWLVSFLLLPQVISNLLTVSQELQSWYLCWSM